MAQKGKFLLNRSGYSLFWENIWYNNYKYSTNFYQNILIKDLILLFLKRGFTFMDNLLNLSNLNWSNYKFKENLNIYRKKWKKDIKINNKYFIKEVRGMYLTKYNTVRYGNNLIIFLSFYKYKTSKNNKNTFIFFLKFKSFYLNLFKKINNEHLNMNFDYNSF
uniref:Ribosomal protein S3 n=1 Tax=Gruberia lanceolata TaxID=1978530 RepID=A0A6C0UA51_9CILI|nr:ribosomal protein S3 [Gruberia lanceolata]